jgi:predicted PurR-regulated permease PerM
VTQHQEPSTPQQWLVPVPRAAVLLLGAAAAVVVAAACKAAAGIVAPVMLALVLSIAVLPLRRWADRSGWPSWAATLLMMAAAYFIVLVLLGGLVVSVVKLAATLPQYADRADELSADLQQSLTDLGLDADPLATAVGELDLAKVTDLLTDLLTGLLGVLGDMFFLVTLLFFLAIDASGVARRSAALGAWKPGLNDALVAYVHVMWRYLVVTAAFGAIVAVFDVAALWLLGVPLPLLWGFLSFVTNFVPNIGFVIGLIPPALLALLDQGWEQMLAVVAVYCVINMVIQTFIQPRVVGDAVGLGTTVTFLSLAVWTYLLGGLGALLAVPITLLVRAVLIDADPNARWALALVGSDETARRLDGAARPRG